MHLLEGGGTVTADAADLREPIRDPQARIVAGYDTTQMPDFDLEPGQVDDLVAYLESRGRGSD